MKKNNKKNSKHQAEMLTTPLGSVLQRSVAPGHKMLTYTELGNVQHIFTHTQHTHTNHYFHPFV